MLATDMTEVGLLFYEKHWVGSPEFKRQALESALGYTDKDFLGKWVRVVLYSTIQLDQSPFTSKFLFMYNVA